MNDDTRAVIMKARRWAVFTVAGCVLYVSIMAVPAAAEVATGTDLTGGSNLPLVALGSALTAMVGLVVRMLTLLVNGGLVPKSMADHQAEYLKLASDSQKVATQLAEIAMKADAREERAEVRERELWEQLRAQRGGQ